MCITLQEDTHLRCRCLRFLWKWVINTAKLSMQIRIFWQNSRPSRPKMALFQGIKGMERAIFGSFCSTSTHEMQTFGRGEIRINIFVHTAAFNTCNEVFCGSNTVNDTFVCCCGLATAVWNICVHCCIPTLKNDTFVKSPYQV